jgi:hypothetical protein
MMLSRTYLALLFAAAVCVSCDKVPLTAPVNSTLTVNAGTTVLPIGGSTQVQATVIEQAGTPVHDGTTVRFTTTLGRLDPPDPQTHNGVATTTFLAGDTSGLAEVRATSGGAGSTTPTTPTTPTSPTTPTTTATSSNVVMISVGTGRSRNSHRAGESSHGFAERRNRTGHRDGHRNGRTLAVELARHLPPQHAVRSAPGRRFTDANGEARVTLMTNADTDVTATAGTKTSTAAKVTSQPGPSVTLTCAVGSTNNCASVSTGDTATFTAARASTSSAIRTSTLDFGDGQSQSLGSLSSSVQVSASLQHGWHVYRRAHRVRNQRRNHHSVNP